jgi:putative tryptophan/tyrosine transport system substrate-binding protein
MIARRALCALFAAWLLLPATLLAQQKRIGLLSPASAKAMAHLRDTFREGLADVGLNEGRNYTVDARWADGDASRLPALARELVASKPALILAHGTTAAAALKNATSAIPIVMVSVDDPVRAGFAKGLRRPGGNITGVTSAMQTGDRQMEMLKQINPKLGAFAVVVNPANPFHDTAFRALEGDAKNQKIRAMRASVASARDIDKAFAALKRAKAQGVIVLEDPLFILAAPQLVKAAGSARLPLVSAQSELTDAGGLASYGSNSVAVARRAAAYSAKVLNGFKVPEMAIEPPAKMDLVVNVKAARALKVALPKDLVGKADRVIQ